MKNLSESTITSDKEVTRQAACVEGVAMYCHPLPPLPCATQKRVTVTSTKTRGIKRKNLFAGKYFICITRWRHRTSEQRIYILIIKVNKLISFFSSWCFLKEIEKCTSCLYRVIQTLVKALSLGLRTQKSCGNTSSRRVFPQHFSFSQTSTRVCIAR